MTCAYKVEAVRVPLLWYLGLVSTMSVEVDSWAASTYSGCVKGSACDVQRSHQRHPFDGQTFPLSGEAVEVNAV